MKTATITTSIFITILSILFYSKQQQQQQQHNKLPRFAIVLPHIPGDESKILHTLNVLYKLHKPCNKKLPIDLVLYSSKHTNLENVQNIPIVKQCFKNTKILINPLTKEQDVYFHAPPLMWLNLMIGETKSGQFLRKNYDYFMLMEPDVLPVQDFWLENLYNNHVLKNSKVLKGEAWWVKGNIGIHTHPPGI